MAVPWRPFLDESSRPFVRGYLHEVCGAANGLVLTHGAGSNCRAPLLVAVAEAFAAAGWTVLRCDLPFRQTRPHGPPFPAMAAQDRDGLRRAVQLLRRIVSGRVGLGGHSYGGRQATIAAAEDPQLADALLLLSYPLHPPSRPAELRTAHFPRLLTPALFVHGARDPFGSIDEMRQALQLVPAERQLLEVEGAGHDLAAKPPKAQELATRLVAEFPSLATSTKSVR
jgi:predicted alpha/beta-hydrolase family hydrolase